MNHTVKNFAACFSCAHEGDRISAIRLFSPPSSIISLYVKGVRSELMYQPRHDARYFSFFVRSMWHVLLWWWFYMTTRFQIMNVLAYSCLEHVAFLITDRAEPPYGVLPSECCFIFEKGGVGE